MRQWKEWGSALGLQTGVAVAVVPGPLAEMDLLNSLARGGVHVAYLSPLAASIGAINCWVEIAGRVEQAQGSSNGAMFVSRNDSGLVAGESELVLRQLEGRTPCYPVIDRLPSPPLENYLVPSGLLTLKGIDVGEPYFMEGPAETWYHPSLESGVYARNCDFAAVANDAPDRFLDFLPREAEAMGASFDSWARQMQVLYTTGPLIPPYAIGLSQTLPASQRAQLAQAILSLGSPYGENVQAPDRELESRFESIVGASSVDVASWLTKVWWTPAEEVSQISWQRAPGSTAVIDIPTNTGSPLPMWGSDPLSRLVSAAISAGLTGTDSSGQEFAVLARAVPSLAGDSVRFEGAGVDEHLVMEYRLRDGITWHDGVPISGRDAAFTWSLLTNPAWPFSRRTQVGLAPEAYVSSVESPSEDRLIFRFMSEREAKEAALAGGRIRDASIYAELATQEGPVVPLDFLDVGRVLLPGHLLADVAPADLPQSTFAVSPVLAGPYRLTGGNGQTGAVFLEAFDGFALGPPSIGQIALGASAYSVGAPPYWQPPNLLADAFKVGAISAQLGLPAVNSRQGEDPLAYDALAEQGLAAVEWVPRQAWETLDFNLDSSHLADLRVREAIAHAIDREKIILEVLDGHGELMRSYLPNWHPLYAGDAALPSYDYNPEEARRLLREAGYDLSRFPANHPQRGPLHLLLASMDVNVYPRPPIAEIIRKDLAAIGIEVEVQFYSWPEFEGQDCTAVRNGRRFDLGLAGWLGAPSLYPVRWVRDVTLTESIPTWANGCPYEKSNWSGWRNADADTMYDETLRNGRFALEHHDLYRQAWADHQVLWATDLPSIPLFNPERPVTISPRLRGVLPSPFGIGGGVEDTWNIYEWELTPR
ncbi:MAG: ABC transporter substrate-binding protein [Anaerolineales bacterium]